MIIKNFILILFLMLTGCSASHHIKQDEQVVVNLGNIGDIEKYYLNKADSLLATQADKMEAYNTLANYYIKYHDYNSARFYLNKTHGTPENDLILAKIDILTGKTSQAISRLQHVNPEKRGGLQAEFYNLLGVSYSLSGQYANAMDMFGKARQLSGNSLIVRNNIAFCYILQKKYNEAEDILSAILDIKPEYVQARSNLNLINSLREKAKSTEVEN